MNHFQKTEPSALPGNLFELIGKDWMLITAGDSPEHHNTMTASWGGAGVLWNKPVAFCFIRPQRYTYEFVEREEFFTLSFFPDGFRQTLQRCGTKSGRELDKAKECGLTPIELDGGIAYQEARLILVCKKCYFSDIQPEQFLDPEIDRKNYPGKDYHRMYIGDIVAAYTAK